MTVTRIRSSPTSADDAPLLLDARAVRRRRPRARATEGVAPIVSSYEVLRGDVLKLLIAASSCLFATDQMEAARAHEHLGASRCAHVSFVVIG
jgi:hypothetical protein